MKTEKQLKEAIYSKCLKKECNGTFMTMVQLENSFKLVPCSCFETLVRNGKYDVANIPEEFWDFSINDVEKGFDETILKDYQIFTENISLSLKNKVQFYFQGLNGRGKTTLAILMLKEVLNKGYQGKIYKAFELIDLLYTNEIDKIDNLDFIVVDEIDKLRSEKQILDLSAILTDLMDRTAVVFISNNPIQYLKNSLQFPEYLVDRLNSIYLLEFKGVNYRQSFIPKFEALKQSLETNGN